VLQKLTDRKLTASEPYAKYRPEAEANGQGSRFRDDAALKAKLLFLEYACYLTLTDNTMGEAFRHGLLPEQMSAQENWRRIRRKASISGAIAMDDKWISCRCRHPRQSEDPALPS
jgi:hypothetical protein